MRNSNSKCKLFYVLVWRAFRILISILSSSPAAHSTCLCCLPKERPAEFNKMDINMLGACVLSADIQRAPAVGQTLD